jgi:hypothetical protein
MKGGFTVPPLSRPKIYERADRLRRAFAPLMQGPRLPIERLYETLHLVLPGFEFEVCEKKELGQDHGRTFPERRLIQLRDDVYEGMCGGSGRDRFTAAHELGHLFLHTGISFARAFAPGGKLYTNSEWQANSFASALLIDDALLPQFPSVEQVMAAFGVSEAAAKARLKK